MRHASIASRRRSPAAAPRCSIAPPTGRIIAPSSPSRPTASASSAPRPRSPQPPLPRSTSPRTPACTRASARSTCCRSCRSARRRWTTRSPSPTPSAARSPRRCGVPVFLYEAAARSAERRPLEAVRRGGLAGLAARLREPAWQPDYGPAALHPTAGAMAIGARGPLVAWNLVLDRADLPLARHIARTIRTSGGGLPCLKALGLAARAHRPGAGVDEPDRLPHDVDGRRLPCGRRGGAARRRSDRGQRDHRPRAARRARRSRERGARARGASSRRRCSKIGSPRAACRRVGPAEVRHVSAESLPLRLGPHAGRSRSSRSPSAACCSTAARLRSSRRPTVQPGRRRDGVLGALWLFAAGCIYAANQQWIGRARGEHAERCRASACSSRSPILPARSWSAADLNGLVAGPW